ncbi:MAG: YihY/virulence factor BrkB family protein [Acidobacteria bacterium]|jgi:membrane protein|nr:YihY/virulence factor BrkB family protein [Acidobacteriota bacterium]
MNFDYKDFFKRIYAKMFDSDMLSQSAQVAFYFTFALFPLLLLIISIFGILLSNSDDLRAELFVYLRQVMPGTAFALVQTTLEEVATNTGGGKLTFGLLATIWSASAGIDSLRSALDGVYNLKETRSYWKTRLLSIVLTLGIGVLILIAVGLIFYGSQLLTFVLPIESPLLLKILGFATVFVVLVLAFALIYNFLPNHNPFSWKWITPGAFTGIILWLILSGAFRLYLHFFDTYAKTYGSLGAVIVLLLWLYLTALVILIGGAINSILDENTGVSKAATDPAQVKSEQKTANSSLGDALQKLPNAEVEDTSDNSKKSSAKKAKTSTGAKSESDEQSPPQEVEVVVVEEKSYGKMIAGGILGGLIAYFSKKKK